MDIRLPSGLLVQGIPDGTPKDEIRRKLIQSGRATYADFNTSQPEQYDVTQDMSGWQKFVAGYGKSAVDLGRGVEQAARSLVPGVSGREKELQTEIDNSRELDANLMTGAGLAGNVIGGLANLAPAALVPGANTYAGAAALGALTGALNPVATGDSRLTNAGIGATGGLVGRAVGGALSRGLAPQTDDAARLLMQEGVTPTPGQIAGGIAKRVEDSATSIPGVGDLVRVGQRRAVEDFNKAALNRALKPIGKSFDDLGVKSVGREAIGAADDAVSNAYKDLLPKLKVVADDNFIDDLISLDDLAQSLPDARYAQFQKIMDREVLGKFTNYGRMSGESMKEVDSKIGGLARDYMRSQDPEQRALGSALKEMQETIRDLVYRVNPEHKTALKAVNTAYANLKRVDSAAATLGAKEGVFSPAQLKAATRRLDPRMAKRGFGRGDALMQDLAEAGEKILGPTVPDSGTAGRLASMGLLGGGATLLNPTAGAGLLAAGSIYGTNAGQKLMAGLLARRPDLIRALGAGVGTAQPYTGLLGTQLALANQ